MNVYLWAQMSDPGDQLVWLENVLKEMQQNGEVAVLIGHVPPASFDCLSEWSKRYNALLERYQDVVRVSFFGHYHIETFNNMRSWESDKSFGVSHWSSSLTTYSEVLTPAYPSFRRFILDEETMLPVKIETYSMDINVEDPVFELDHEMTSLYGMQDLSPASFD